MILKEAPTYHILYHDLSYCIMHENSYLNLFCSFPFCVVSNIYCTVFDPHYYICIHHILEGFPRGKHSQTSVDQTSRLPTLPTFLVSPSLLRTKDPL